MVVQWSQKQLTGISQNMEAPAKFAETSQEDLKTCLELSILEYNDGISCLSFELISVQYFWKCG